MESALGFPNCISDYLPDSFDDDVMWKQQLEVSLLNVANVHFVDVTFVDGKAFFFWIKIISYLLCNLMAHAWIKSWS